MTKVYITESGYKLNVASTLRMTASEAETLLDGVFEPALGNPDADGYVLSSTAAGVRSWVEGGGGASDVDDLATSTGSSTNMLRVAAAGGLEYRTAAQVLSDIGAAPTASPTFTGTVTLPTTVASVIKPASDSTTALRVTKADGATAVVTVDTTTPSLSVNLGTSAYKYLYLDSTNYSHGFALRRSGNPKWYFENAYRTSQDELRWLNSAGTVVFTVFQNGRAGFGVDPTANVDIAASTTAAASLRIRSGTAPTSPNAGDIWNDGTDFNLYGSGLKLHSGVIKPASDSTTALQLANAAGTAVLTVDTTNNRVGINTSPGGDTFSVSGPNTATFMTFRNSSNSNNAVFQLTTASNNARFMLYNSAGSVFFQVVGTSGTASYMTNPMSFGQSSAPTAYADLAASTTAAASLRIRSGTAPTTPNAGDIWFDGTNLKMYDGSTTRTISWT